MILRPALVKPLRVEYERRKRGWTQRQLGHLAGIQQTHVSMLERGRLNPTENELEALARALGIFPPRLLMQPVLADPQPEPAEKTA